MYFVNEGGTSGPSKPNEVFKEDRNLFLARVENMAHSQFYHLIIKTIFQKFPDYFVFYDKNACTNVLVNSVVNLPLVIFLLNKLLSLLVVNWNSGQCLGYNQHLFSMLKESI